MTKSYAGKLRHRIQIQNRDAGQDVGGQPLMTWTTWQRVWARVVSLSGNEQYRAQQFAPEVSHQVTIRYLQGVNPMQRILTDDGNILDILSVNYPERLVDDAVIIMCKQRIGAAGDVNVG